MSFETLRERIPAAFKDARLNLSAVLDAETAGVPEKTVAYVALVTAYATKDASLVQAALAHGARVLGDQEKISAEVTASVMAMNNIYYRFVHLAEHDGLSKLPAKLRMNHMAKPGVPLVDFELASLAVSALNGCGRCISAHVHALETAGVTLETIQWSARLAAAFGSVAQVLAGTDSAAHTNTSAVA